MIRKGMEKMNFQECLNNYIIQIRCNGKELARNSKISETVISRYRKGERAPSADSEYLKKLSESSRLQQKKASGILRRTKFYRHCVKVWRIIGTNRHLTARNSTFC